MTTEAPGSKQGQQAGGDAEAVQHLARSLAEGGPWYMSLLEAVGLWSSPEEAYKGRRYRYLVGGEAFDWLLLAERLLADVRDKVPEEQLTDLLFQGRPPVELSKDEFKRLIGGAKYKAHLNYVYGVVLEEALLAAAEEEVNKERSGRGFHGGDASLEAFQRLYGAPQAELLARFRQEKGLPEGDSLRLGELRELTYWLFKYRLATCGPERVASDTRKALKFLGRVGGRNLYL